MGYCRRLYPVVEQWAGERIYQPRSCLHIKCNDAGGHVELTIYHADRDLVGPYKITVPASNPSSGFNDLNDPKPIPLATEYSSVFVSDIPIVIQYTRLDSRQSANALLSTIAFAQ